MYGHYHIELESGVSINDGSLSVALKRAKESDPSKIVSIGFVCTYGCGSLHELTLDECDLVSKLFPNFGNTDES